MTMVCLVMNKMLWARHWAPLFPFYVAALGLVLKDALEEKGSFGRYRQFFTVAWLLLLLASALSLRFSAKHAKDDYRFAALLARDYSAKGRTVYWAACWECAFYYRLPLREATATSPLPFDYLPANTPSNNGAPKLPPVVFLSRPSIYDGRGLVPAYAATHKLRSSNNLCHAFTIYWPND